MTLWRTLPTTADSFSPFAEGVGTAIASAIGHCGFGVEPAQSPLRLFGETLPVALPVTVVVGCDHHTDGSPIAEPEQTLSRNVCADPRSTLLNLDAARSFR
jgi:hypothetical protein